MTVPCFGTGWQGLRKQWIIGGYAHVRSLDRKGKSLMAAQKPRTGDGPLEVTKEGRGLVLRLPVEGGGRLVIEISQDEARNLHEVLAEVI